MIVTIIGSCKLDMLDDMIRCEEFFKKFAIVHSPCDPERRNMSLIELQKSWISAIKDADLVVAISKHSRLSTVENTTDNRSEYCLDFGESTSYELAIAYHFNKPVVFWS